MPQRDTIHHLVKQALIKDGWEITDDPYVISYGERFLFVDLGATESNRIESSVLRRETAKPAMTSSITGFFIGARRENSRIAIEIKEFRGQSAIADE